MLFLQDDDAVIYCLFLIHYFLVYVKQPLRFLASFKQRYVISLVSLLKLSCSSLIRSLQFSSLRINTQPGIWVLFMSVCAEGFLGAGRDGACRGVVRERFGSGTCGAVQPQPVPLLLQELQHGHVTVLLPAHPGWCAISLFLSAAFQLPMPNL